MNTNFKSLFENAFKALQELNSLQIEKEDMHIVMQSLGDDSLLRKFAATLRQSKNTYRKVIKKIYVKDKVDLRKKKLIDNCKLKAAKIQEKKHIMDQLEKCKGEPDNLSDVLIEEEESIDKSSLESSDQKGDLSQLKIPINHHSKKISKLNQRPASSDHPNHIRKSKCYVCKEGYSQFHDFYDQLCKQCGDLNYKKRTQKCNFDNRIALVTGCRIKIGYEIALFLLRNNCKVIGTTRFPKDAFERFSKEKDFDSFKDNLVIYPLNLRNLSVLDKFIKHLYETIPQLDILINNAAQTLRRAPIYYQNLLANESKPLELFDNPAIFKALPQEFNIIECNGTNDFKFQIQNDEMNTEITIDRNIAENVSGSVLESLVPLTTSDLNPNLEYFPQGIIDKDNQQVDLSAKTSWNKNIEEIDFVEFAETQVINAWAPWQLNAKLKDLMCKSENTFKFIINVSSMEGKFNRHKKSTHPHTNMSKASLNMMTRTCGSHYAKDKILMNSVDTGWVSEMQPEHLLLDVRTVPLDEIDGAMRVLDPIIQTINNNEIQHSLFLKDYKPTEW